VSAPAADRDNWPEVAGRLQGGAELALKKLEEQFLTTRRGVTFCRLCKRKVAKLADHGVCAIWTLQSSLEKCYALEPSMRSGR
jgi:hypothetical protein